MSTASPEEVVRLALDDIWNKHDVEAFDELYAPDFVNHDPTAPDDTDLASLKRSSEGWFAAFPDFHITIRDLIPQCDRVVKVWTMEGTHKATILDIPPTGRRVKVDGMTIYRVLDGKVVENTWSMDSLGLLQQLGAIPVPEAPVA